MSAATEPLSIRLRRRLDGNADPSRGIEPLILALAAEIKATSNDQNVQRLARDLRAAASEIAANVATAGAD